MGIVTCNSNSWRKSDKIWIFGPYPTVAYGGSGSLPREGYNWDKKLSMCMWLVISFFGGWDDVITTPIRKDNWYTNNGPQGCFNVNLWNYLVVGKESLLLL
jgi:hypothetical protein